MKKNILTEEFLRMQKLAGIITEAEFKEKVKEAENEEAALSVNFDPKMSFPKDDKTIQNIITQLQSGKDTPILKAIASYAGDRPAPTPEKAKQWVEKIGPETVADRIKTIANKIPTDGKPKSDMPFLPGPKDANQEYKPSDVEDALTPGGKYNVDFKEAIEPPAKNTIPKGDETFLKSGEKDGKKEDDKAEVKTPGKVVASNAKLVQSNILLPKALSFAIGGMEGGDLGAYVGTDGEILDGNHRWAATMLNNPNAELQGYMAINLNDLGGKDKALDMLTAIGNAFGNKTKDK